MKTLSTEEVEAGYAVLKALTNTVSPLSDTTWQYFKNCCQLVFYRKKTTFIQEGEQPKMIGYILQGAAKSYYAPPTDDRQIITRMFVPNDICASINFHLNEPSVETIEFVSDSWLIGISYADVITMKATFPDYIRMYAALLGRRIRIQEEKMRDLQMLTVRQRLEKLMATTPYYFKYFSVADIASYLGTERETLTRLRSKLYKQ